MTESILPVFIPLLFLVAFLYASVGHGGASGYLALMVLFGFSPFVMKPTALILNVFVSLIAFLHYYRAGFFRWKLFWPFAIASVPLAFLGGMISVDAVLYKKILGILLVFPVLRLCGAFGKEAAIIRESNLLSSLIIGSMIGFLSGLIGIGGGIILSPVILLLHWAKMKETAATSALFIFVNSMAGLAGQLNSGITIDSGMLIMVFVALAGGWLGSYFGVHRFNSLALRRLLAVVLLIASIKLMGI